MTLFTGDRSKPWMVPHTIDPKTNLLKGKLSAQSIDMRGKVYVLRPVQLVLLTSVLVSLVTGFGLAKEG